ncbi:MULTISPECIES: hypothetical protein [Parachlamydia]|uniref:HEAT repeat domain-containing protein n=2 Tax=Parachlamydia acanthamoebae TaxID=83552 RepID=F8L2M8_PARAV|nr:hypothetical protein [Parachlamydia acanthamoebae]KIA76748.1 hypothetical protein DB43_HK00210 [Parachlamydia acanthamoebae]CCB87556.1 putative uncharacterized protein [Parachlamydia acanthamoebae UV-7]
MTHNPQNDFNEEHSFTNAIDHLILMHRECHFGGHFPTMIDYYEKEGKGVSEDFSLEDINRLAMLEAQMQQNLAALLLTGPEMEKVAQSRDLYKKLRSLYETESSATKIPRLIADLILSERESEEQDIQAVADQKHAVVPALIDLLRSEDFHDPLFPGYGLAPALAAKCLGLVGDKRAIISLFESIGEMDVFDEEITLKALKSIGEPAKEFLMRILKGRPLTYDTERAAIALVSFKDDEDVAQTCLKMLQEKDILSNLSLAPYLILTCEGLKDPAQQKDFKELLNHPALSKELALDIRAVIHSWGNQSKHS